MRLYLEAGSAGTGFFLCLSAKLVGVSYGKIGMQHAYAVFD